jgi:hypothetical protein
MAYIGKTPTIGNFQVCDAITVVDAQAAYTMQVGGVDVSPETANHMLVSLNGILQAPTSSFTVSGSTITFASALETGDVIDFIQILGNVLDLGVPSDNTVSLAKLTATGTKDATTFLRGDNTFQTIGTNTPSFKASASSATTISTGTYTTITFDGTDVWDTDSAFSSNTFTVPSGKDGKYLFCYGIAIASLNDGDFSEIILAVNGTNDESTRYREQTGSAQTTIMRAAAILNLSAGDTVVVKGFHNYGSNRDTTTAQSSFEGFKLVE